MLEQTLALFKPDVAKRHLTNDLINEIKQAGFTIKASKECQPSKHLLETHYNNISAQPFSPGVLAYMSSGPITALILEKENAIQDWRELMGATNPIDAKENTIRGQYGHKIQTSATIENLVHGSDSPENAKREIQLWFPEPELSY